MRALPPLLAALLLAGCAGEPPPAVEPAEPVFHDVPAFQPQLDLAPIEWRVIWEGEHPLTPATPLAATVAVPNGTVQVLVNLTTAAGGSYGLAVDLGECHWRRAVVILAHGQTWGADCGGVLDGDAQLRVAPEAGALLARTQVVALVCDTQLGKCPPRLPPTTA